jgi:RNA polymerase sigma-70 factor (ECF subfamily)
LDLDGLRCRRAEAIDAWFATYADPVYAFILYRVDRNPDLAADVAQDTFVTALTRIEDFDPERGEMLPWLTYTARNCIRKALRQEARYATVSDLWERIDARLAAALSELGEAPLPHQALEREETVELVRAALSNLSLRYQKVLRQHYFQQRTVREIAALEGSTEGAVKVALHRARLAFQAAFESICANLEEGRVRQ